ncbi:unnamed protein product [Bursaphelenchus xylophilus]|uniref:(pine wood nematode) hypothetical protein n=1 Tax=Bursaphelenchus xylophilus TaxID=6326 RepID=A0A811LW18_BURXY|nr:unnamed protein product [Bursaphelenchus xylophilus]CAG9123390.1 unnamed protein product [Bursaphelenchus xylophilus]
MSPTNSQSADRDSVNGFGDMALLRPSIVVALTLVVVYGLDSFETTKRRLGRPMNPYSWQNGGYKIKRSLENELETETGALPEEKRAPMPRNPYSWLARSQKEGPYQQKRTRDAYFWNNQDFLLDSLFRSETKKSPYVGFNGRRARNPYSWMNFV